MIHQGNEFRGAGVYAGMSDEVYHADPVPGGSLSSTGARQILSSPAMFRYRQQHRENTKAFDIGHAVHAKVLGAGLPVAIIPDELLASNGAASTKAAKDFIEQARAAGQTPLKASEFYPIRMMSEALLAHPTVRALLEVDGIPEASLFATDPITDEWVRARPDFLPSAGVRPRTIAVDLKTAETADPRQFRRSAATFGYHQQHAHYIDTLRAARGDEDAALVFAIVEKSEPWLVSVCELGPDSIDKGRARNRAALDLWHRCRQTGLWPGYGDEVHRIDLPVWALTEEDAA